MTCYSSRLLTLLWAAALIFSGLGPYYGAHDAVAQWPSFLIVVAGLIVLGAHQSLVTVGLSAAIFLISFVAQMPINPNHRWILLYVSLAIIIRLRTAKTVDLLWQAAQGSLQWLAVIVYEFATLAKLNAAYFTPEISCAGVFGWQAAELYGLSVSDAMKGSSLMALVTVLAEGLLPLALLWKRTRCAAVFCGIVFHIGLSLHFVRYFANFSSVMFILLASFLPETSCESIYRALKSRLLVASRVWAGAIIILVAAAILSLASLVEYGIARYVLYMLFALSLATLTFYSVLGVRCDARVGRPITLIMAFALVNACAPYLGLKTRSAFTMYSNLRIEPGYSNHFFMPTSFDLFGYLSDTVQISHTSDPSLQERVSRESAQMAYLSLCTYLACQDDICKEANRSGTVSYYRGGELVHHDLRDPLPPSCPPWMARKLLLFGPTGPDSERECVW
jgi:hypothetical protein